MDKKIPIVHPLIDEYMLALLPKRDGILREMESYARRKKFPIIGPLAGRVLAQLAMIQKPKRIVELGSGFGYSAYWLAKATPSTTKIFCSDGDENNYQKASAYFKRVGMSRRIKYFVGDALDFIDQFEDDSLEFILNDIDKEDYPAILAKAVRKLKKGGLLVTDNVLWSGRVLHRHPAERSSQAIKVFNRDLFTSKSFFSTILPVRDGIAVCVKR